VKLFHFFPHGNAATAAALEVRPKFPAVRDTNFRITNAVFIRLASHGISLTESRAGRALSGKIHLPPQMEGFASKLQRRQGLIGDF
jgi:hypothetical protein